jgi:hypothetical protein
LTSRLPGKPVTGIWFGKVPRAGPLPKATLVICQSP